MKQQLVVFQENVEPEYSIFGEMWRPITCFSVPDITPNAYYISSFGRVYSFLSEKILAQVMTDNGYLRVNLRDIYGNGRYHLTHRILMIEFNYIFNYQSMQVNHINGNKNINWFPNLEWCTAQENIIHSINTGLKTIIKGEDCSYATITNDQADLIGQLIQSQQYTNIEISNIIGCPVHIINNISSGNTWKDVYIKYNLELYKKKENSFSDNELELLCKYLQDNINNYKTNSDLFRAALNDLFNIKYTNAMSATLCRIINKKVRKNITEKYNFNRTFNDYPDRE